MDCGSGGGGGGKVKNSGRMMGTDSDEVVGPERWSVPEALALRLMAGSPHPLSLSRCFLVNCRHGAEAKLGRDVARWKRDGGHTDRKGDDCIFNRFPILSSL